MFLGIRLQCARCHNHPFDVWTQDDYYGLAAFFANIGRKESNNVRRDRLDKHEINGDEIILPDGPHPRWSSPGPGPTFGRRSCTDRRARKPPTTDHLAVLADWLTRNNRQFDRNLANRIWYHLMGRGIVEPVDDFRDSNPPSNPALLDALTTAFVERGMRLRPLVALDHEVANLPGSTPRPTRPTATTCPTSRMPPCGSCPAEVLLDAITPGRSMCPNGSDAPRARSGPPSSRARRSTCRS